MQWPSARLTDLLGIEHPILQAPMSGYATPELVAAVARFGGLGGLGFAGVAAADIAAQLRQTMALTNRPFQANFFAHDAPRDDPEKATAARALVAPLYEEIGAGPVPQPVAPFAPFDAEMLEAVLAARPKVVSFHFGLPEEALLAPLRDAGCLLMCTATTPREAKALEDAGVDIVIAQGWEAGGHRGEFLDRGGSLGTLALVPQVADAVSIPVVAAGGIADGRGIAACFALGADGVQLGSAFLSTPEAATPAPQRDTIAHSDGAQTHVTRAVSGRPARMIANRYTEALAPHEAGLPDFPVMFSLSGPLKQAGYAAGTAEYGALYSGQAIGLNRSLPAGDLLARLVTETAEAFQRLGRAT